MVLQPVSVEPKELGDYLHEVGEQTIEELRRMAKPLKGARVLHLNATAFGGGVAELLYSLVPLMRDVGLEVEWRIIYGNDPFFNVTKEFHNGLQGAPVQLTDRGKELYLDVNKLNAQAFEGEYDFVVIHDPQPAAMLSFLDRNLGRHWIWRCHIDTSKPNAEVLAFLTPYLVYYDAAIFTMPSYVPPSVNFRRLNFIRPAIDPLSVKNRDMTREEALETLKRYGVDPDRPVITQISRFDPWKDPLGVINAYRMVKVEIPEAQLVLAGSIATDDPEGWDYYERTVRKAGEDLDIHILHNFQGVGALEVNAFQRASTVVVQKSTREGFGLVVAEALWKGKAVVAGNVGGIPLQVIDGKTGYLVDDALGTAQRVYTLLKHPNHRDQLGLRALEHVREHFLTPRLLRDYLQLFTSLERSQGKKSRQRQIAARAPGKSRRTKCES
jgi:trehalose synthase